jgi:uncharacterized protein YktA (UPF0223 family)
VPSTPGVTRTVREPPGQPDADPETGEIVDAEVVISDEQVAEILGLFESITDAEERKVAKEMFLDLYGKPADLPASRYEDALRVVRSQVEAQGVAS